MSSKQQSFRSKVLDYVTGGALSTARQKSAEASALQIEVTNLRSENQKLRTVQLAQPSYVGWMGVPRVVYNGGKEYNYVESNMLAATPTPRMCIRRKKMDVMDTAWEVVPLPNGEGKITDKAREHARKIFEWLYFRPNSNGESFRSMTGKLSDDLDKHDAAVLTKTYGRNGDRRLVEINVRDGSLFTKDIDTYLNLGVVYPHYTMDGVTYKNLKVGYWYNWDSTPKVAYEPHEVCYMMEDPRSDIPYGTSPCNTLRTVLLSLMYDHEFYNEYGASGFKNPSVIGPDAATSSTTSGVMTETDFKTYKGNIKEQMKQYIPMIVTNSKTTVSPLSDMKLMQWLETKEDYQRLCIANFNLTPAALGYIKDTQKSTEQSQMALYLQRGLLPRLKMIEWYMNTQVIAEWYWKEEKERNVFAHGHVGRFADESDGYMDCMLRFKLRDPASEAEQLKIDIDRIKAGFATINSVLKEQGREPVAWGDYLPLFLFNPQQWGQSYSGGAIKASTFKEITGIEPAVKDIMQATQGQSKPQQNAEQPKPESDAMLKAYAVSRTDGVEGFHKPGKYSKGGVET